jgi:predicted amino acid-binding ACT domain protein
MSATPPPSAASQPVVSPPVVATLLVSCRDRTGLVAALSDFVFRNEGNILDADQHADRETGLFSMRLVWDLGRFRLARAEIATAIADLAARFELSWEITYSDERTRVAIFASKTPHCLYDLLLSHQLGELRGDLALIIANHADLAPVAGHFGVPFVHLPVDPGDKARRGGAAAPAGRAWRRPAGASPLHATLSPAFVARWPGGSSTSTTPSCPPSSDQALPPGQEREVSQRRHRLLRDLRADQVDHRQDARRVPPRRRRDLVGGPRLERQV